MVTLTPEQDELMIKVTYKIKEFIEKLYDHEMSDEETDKAAQDISGIVGMIYGLGEKAPNYIHTLYTMTGKRIPPEVMIAIATEFIFRLYKHDLVIIKDILPNNIKQGDQNLDPL